MHPDLEDPAPWAVGLGPGHLAIMFEHVWIKPTNKSTINQLYSQPKHKQPVTYVHINMQRIDILHLAFANSNWMAV